MSTSKKKKKKRDNFLKNSVSPYPFDPLAAWVGWETVTSAGLCQKKKDK